MFVTQNYISECKPVIVLVVGDSHVREFKEMISLENVNSKAYFRSFSAANSNQLNHYIIPSVADGMPNAVISSIIYAVIFQ